jgi:type IV secretory pathway VirB6-like protein
MNLVRKISQIFTIILFVFFLTSCEEGCVEPDQFDAETSVVESYPVQDGVVGSYNHISGGQRAEWHETGLRSNGDNFLIFISGGWTPWYRSEMSADDFSALSLCNICSKKSNDSSPNCLCGPGQTPAAEKLANGGLGTADCSTTSNYTNQNNPNLCTCTLDPSKGRYSDLDVYHFPLNIYTKDEIRKIADKQSTCRYSKGMGLYLGLFGSNGTSPPKRLYHLHTAEAICNINPRSDGACVDASGNDRTLYVYRSSNNRIFVKDDQALNNGTDTNSGDDEYHGPNEKIKLIIYDRYYEDNYGRYNLSFVRGVGSEGELGLIEFLVRLVEDALLGKKDEDDVRQGGVIEFMYKAITKNSGFILALQISLSLYIALYGAATLFGVAEINKKEIMGRLLKIGLVLLFTSERSWELYNQLVVGFFKDSMDYVVSMMMSLSDSQIEPTAMVKVAQMDRAASNSNATRFSYADAMIKRLMSDAVAKKVFGLFFGVVFGLIYIFIIYGLIAYFIYVMLFAGMIYLTNMVKIIFMLALGPIFMCFTLFSHTNDMFKKWIGFLGARSLEIIFVFTILYNFLALIDRAFTDLLSYRTCVNTYYIIPKILPIKILESEVPYSTRSLFEWIAAFVKIAGLIFITREVIAKVGDISGQLISIGGIDNKDGNGKGRGADGFEIANDAMGTVSGGLSKAVKATKIKSIAAGAVKLGTQAARSSGIAAKWNALGDKTGIPGPRTLVRNMMVIRGAINQGRADSKAKGFTGKEADENTRAVAAKALQSKMFHDPNKMAFLGVNMENISKRFEQKLVKDPLKNIIKEEGKKIRESGLAGKEARQALRANVRDRLGNEMINGADVASRYLGQGKDTAAGLSAIKSQQGDAAINALIRSNAGIDTSLAAKIIAKDSGKEAGYQKSIDDDKYRAQKLDQRAANGTYWGQMARGLTKRVQTLGRKSVHNSDMARENLARKVERQKHESEFMKAQDQKGGIKASINKGAYKLKSAMTVNVLGKGSQKLAKALTKQSAKKFFEGKQKTLQDKAKKAKERAAIGGKVSKNLNKALAMAMNLASKPPGKIAGKINDNRDISGRSEIVFEKKAAEAARKSMADRMASGEVMSKEKLAFLQGQLQSMAKKFIADDVDKVRREIGQVKDLQKSRLDSIEDSKKVQEKAIDAELKEKQKYADGKKKESDKESEKKRADDLRKAKTDKEKEGIKKKTKLEKDASSAKAKSDKDAAEVKAKEEHDKLNKKYEEDKAKAELENKEWMAKLVKGGTSKDPYSKDAAEVKVMGYLEKLVDKIDKSDLTAAEKIEQLKYLRDEAPDILKVDTNAAINRIIAAVGDFGKAEQDALQAKIDAAQKALEVSKNVGEAVIEVKKLKGEADKIMGFGANIKEMGLSGSIADVGLKGGSVMLGGSGIGGAMIGGATVDADAAIKDLQEKEIKAKKHQAEMKLKLSRVDKTIAEMKFAELKDKGDAASDAEKREMSSLTGEIANIEKEMSLQSRAVESFS